MAKASHGAVDSGKLLSMIDELLGLHRNIDDVLKTEEDKEFTKEEKEIVQQYEEGIQKLLDVIAPAGVKFERGLIQLSDNLVARSFYAYNWPSQIYPNLRIGPIKALF